MQLFNFPSRRAETLQIFPRVGHSLDLERLFSVPVLVLGENYGLTVLKARGAVLFIPVSVQTHALRKIAFLVNWNKNFYLPPWITRSKITIPRAFWAKEDQLYGVWANSFFEENYVQHENNKESRLCFLVHACSHF